MNNDVSLNNKNYLNAIKVPSLNIKEETSVSKNNLEENPETIEKSVSFLGAMGRVQVKRQQKNQNERVQSYIKEFQKNPEHVQFYNHVYDGFLNKGYSAQNALKSTDMIFQSLKDEKTYN